MKEAWDASKDALVKSGAFAIQQLSEALSAIARLENLPQGLPEKALQKCAEQVQLLVGKYFLSDEALM